MVLRASYFLIVSVTRKDKKRNADIRRVLSVEKEVSLTQTRMPTVHKVAPLHLAVLA